MRLELRRIDALPRLAWCARVSQGRDTVVVQHGPGVECWDDGFCEGAWAGSFGEAGFDRALAFAGTGGRVRGGGLLFVSGTALGDHLCLVRRGRHLFVSNSAVFAMVAAGDAPSPGLPYCEHHYFRREREGLHSRHRRMPTRHAGLEFHDCANLAISPSLRVERIEKPVPPEPRDFKDYVGLLDGVLGGIFRNAADPERRAQRYRPLATLTRGYDSPALAVLAQRHGCHEAATLLGPDGQDDGREIGRIMGLETKAYPSRFIPETRPWPEAEFCVCPHGSTHAWLAAEGDLAGRLLLTGASGDALLGTRSRLVPDLRRDPRFGMGGTQNEFRLRVGFNTVKPYFTGWQHAAAIRAISRSEELRPWSVGGDYDRPILRRIVEDAGVPRDAFGRTKLATVSRPLAHPDDLCPPSRLDYEAFVRKQGIPLRVRATARLGAWLYARAPRSSRRRIRGWTPARWRLSASSGYLYHWGFERVAERYRIAGPAPRP